jgi:hypothetical protein
MVSHQGPFSFQTFQNSHPKANEIGLSKSELASSSSSQRPGYNTSVKYIIRPNISDPQRSLSTLGPATFIQPNISDPQRSLSTLGPATFIQPTSSSAQPSTGSNARSSSEMSSAEEYSLSNRQSASMKLTEPQNQVQLCRSCKDCSSTWMK